MKLFAILFAILAIVSSTMALKHRVCALTHSKSTNRRGNTCFASIASYTYKADTNECIFFIYGGCYGNRNRFNTLEKCQKKCVE